MFIFAHLKTIYALFNSLYTVASASVEQLLAAGDLMVTPVGPMHLPITQDGRCAS